jgi:chromosomal replication initiation ATPase DnaA
LLHGRRDLRWLLSVLDALDRCSLQTRRPITLSLLREVLQAVRAGGAPSAGPTANTQGGVDTERDQLP